MSVIFFPINVVLVEFHKFKDESFNGNVIGRALLVWELKFITEFVDVQTKLYSFVMGFV
jgi:hypothetical protein